MDILIVNPNTTASMTEKVRVAGCQAAGAGTVIRAVNPADGPESIEGYFDEAYSLPGLLAEIRRAPAADAYVLACFDDSGLDAARCAAPGPVVGIGEAAFHLASLIAGRFGVVTTLERSVPIIERNLHHYGLVARCSGVRASNVPVLDLEDPASDARGQVSETIARAIRDDRAEAIVLGCAGMADLARDLARQHQLPVLDGVACAVRLAESLVALGLGTSRQGAYAAPRGKRYAGIFAAHAPR